MRLHQTLFFTLLCLLPTQLVIHFWPEWASVLGRRIDYLSPTVFLTDVVIFLILVLFGFEKVSRASFSFATVFSRRTIAWQKLAPWLVVILLVGINLGVASNKPEAIYKWL